MKYLLALCSLILFFSYTPAQKKSNIGYSSIEYEATDCYGTCPVYTMIITFDRTAVLNAKNFNSDIKSNDQSRSGYGSFKANLSETDYKTLISLLNDLKVKSLKAKYSINYTDFSTYYLRVKFSDGTKKVVEDYGGEGSDKLIRLHRFFEYIRKNQYWTKVK